MAFKLITVLCATLAYANAGLLAQTAYSAPVAHYSSAPAVSHVYSSVAHQPAVLAHAPVVAAPAYAQSYAVAPAVKTYAAAPVLHAPISKVAYSPASEVSHVYSSIAAPQYAYSAHAAPQYAYSAHAAPQYAYGAHAAPLAIHSPAIGSSQQNTYRSLGGTISTHSKAVNSAFSSDIRSDTRISNNVYIPALATKTIAYQQPAILEQKHIPATVVSHVAFDGIGAHYAW
ncbi:cuticle protein LPCP-23-like isoform X2 [Sitodiplosis mosellana]|uniref:cuticle protein LPCP-23-like isoform X2 n=1 Tax=Sitodiplosis mosellana TaxID=263140 RepID=UPI0024452816|nr:cuticle protein LPCP-23-like isoform X2 [Sitodiplosis mosellana]